MDVCKHDQCEAHDELWMSASVWILPVYTTSRIVWLQVENQRVFAVKRRLCVDMADVRCMKKSWARGLDAEFVNILFGTLLGAAGFQLFGCALFLHHRVIAHVL